MYVVEIICNLPRPVTKINAVDSERWEKQPSGGRDKLLPAALFHCQLNRAILETKLLKHTAACAKGGKSIKEPHVDA